MQKKKIILPVFVIILCLSLIIIATIGMNKNKASEDAELGEVYELTTSEPEALEIVETPVTIEQWQPMRLIIPAINIDLLTIGGGSVFDEVLLRQGPTHFNDLTSMGLNVLGDLPNTERGNVAFAGYRRGRLYSFLDLDKLEEGDEIYLDVAGYRFVYCVEWVKIVDKYDWEPLETTDTPVITLQTGEPPYVADPDFRLMVRGSLVKVLLVNN